MDVLQVQGDAFSEYYLHKILPQEAKLAPRLDAPGAERSWRPITSLLRNAHRELRGSRQVRVTRRVLLDPLAELLGWRLGDPEAIQTSLGEEDGSQPLFLNGSEKAAARVLAGYPRRSLSGPSARGIAPPLRPRAQSGPRAGAGRSHLGNPAQRV
jgi:hypothetical protein